MTNKCKTITNYIINEVNLYNADKDLNSTVFLSTKRLNKILFFCDLRYMLLNNGKSMFDEKFYVWPSGPVIPELYREYICLQNENMKPFKVEEIYLDDDIKKVIDEIIDITKDYDTIDLVNLSKENWYSNDVLNEPLSKADVYNNYSYLIDNLFEGKKDKEKKLSIK